jgi:hypothetical protein
MTVRHWFVTALLWMFIMAAPAVADEKKQKPLPWQKANLNLGLYWAGTDSSLKLNSQEYGIGLNLDLEDTLGLKSDNSAFRVDAGWRFSKNMRHKMEFSWFRFDREGSKYFKNTIEIPDGEDGTTTLGPGSMSSVFSFDIYKLKYEYSFFLDDRLDINAGLGVFIMPIEFGISGTIDGVGQRALLESVTAPLPVLGLGFDFAITPEWFIRQQADLLYLEMAEFKGSIMNYVSSVEYLPWKHVGIGLGIDFMRVAIDAKGGDYPGIDFIGSVNFNLIGGQLYLKFYL